MPSMIGIIGRADHLYNYNGFTRTLNFSFNVVVNSITELFPVWKKINYLASAVKPANYTTAGSVVEKNFNRFMIPPMFMITIGDMYKFQPVVITSINVNIPDDAAWETLNEVNAKEGWGYLNDIIYSSVRFYGQLPREAEIQITCNLLEKERAIVGAAHYGHAPHTDLYLKDEFNVNEETEYLPKPSDLHKEFIVYQGGSVSTVQAYKDEAQKRDTKANEEKSKLDAASAVIETTKPATSTPTTTGANLGSVRQKAVQLQTGPNQLGSAARVR